EEEEEEEEAGDYSGTNTQEQDVDEADFVKNDGGYIYVLADGRFQVLDAWPADQAHALSSFPIEGTPRRMYVYEDTAVVYASLDTQGYNKLTSECTYGYDCDFTGDGTPARISILDISDRQNPVLT
ncbi:MAG: beta-propeller domain-containing protein, partial [Myxococcales bacterium]|nr:beta-propeller domain-containing protein [Myxococcales bacterium]